MPVGAPDEAEAMAVIVPAAGEARLVRGSPAQNASIFKQQVDKIMEGDDLCIVCFEQPPAVLLMPCAHICACEACAPSLSKCPVCSCLVENRQAATMKAVVKNKIRSEGHALADGPREEGGGSLLAGGGPGDGGGDQADYTEIYSKVPLSLHDGADASRTDSKHKTPVDNGIGMGRASSIRTRSGKSPKIEPGERGSPAEVRSLPPQRQPTKNSPGSADTVEAARQGSTQSMSYLDALWRYFNHACIRPQCVRMPEESEQAGSEEQE
jgi:hypothetical protein